MSDKTKTIICPGAIYQFLLTLVRTTCNFYKVRKECSQPLILGGLQQDNEPAALQIVMPHVEDHLIKEKEVIPSVRKTLIV